MESPFLICTIFVGKRIKYVDETNFNLFCKYTKGYSKKGTRAKLILPPSKGPNVHLIGAISEEGVIKMDRRRGAYKMMDAHNWFRALLNQIRGGGDFGEMVFVVDNAPCHSRLEEVMAEIIEAPTLLRLGPYSPMLNAIENIWSKIKTHVKETNTRTIFQRTAIGKERLVYLETLIDTAKGAITAMDCVQATQLVLGNFTRALEMADMAVGT